MRTPHPLVELTRVRFLEFLREPEAVFWTFLFPILLTAGLGIAFRNRAPDVTQVAVVSGLPASTAVQRAVDSDSLLSSTLLSDSAAARALQLGTVAVVIVPRTPTDVEYRFDQARPESRQAQFLADRAIQQGAGASRPVATTVTNIPEPGSRYVDFVLPGLLAMNLMGSGIWGIGFAIVDARRKKLLKRFVATPMRRTQFLASFLLMRLGLMAVECVVILAFGRFVFGVPLRGSLATLALVVLAGTLSFGGIGLLLASRARTVEAASGLMNLVMVPMWVGSGVFFAATRFPDVVQPLIQALPLTAVVDALRLNMLQGAGLAAVGSELAILAAWLVATFATAMRVFRWQ